MMHLCPFCGHTLEHIVNNGIGSCVNCKRVFDSTPFTNLLSAGWMVRMQHITDPKRLKSLGLNENQALLVVSFVYENSMSHEDFEKALNDIGISKKDLQE